MTRSSVNCENLSQTKGSCEEEEEGVDLLKEILGRWRWTELDWRGSVSEVVERK